MKKTFVQAFKLSNYHEDSYIIKNPQFHRYELINNYQLNLLEQLREGVDLATILFPKTGVATTYHFQNCIHLVRKLQNLHLLKLYDESVLKDDPTRTTQVTMDLLTVSHSLAEKFIQFGGRLFSYLPSSLFFMIFSVSMITTVFFAPGLISNMTWSFSTLGSILVVYFGVSLCLLIRQLVRAAYLYRTMRSPFLIRFSFLSIFPTISLNASDVWMEGYKSRLNLTIIGILSPFIVSFLSIGLSVFSIISFDLAAFFVAASSIAFFLNLFPLFGEDGSELIYLFSSGRKGTALKNRTHTDLKAFIKRALFTSTPPSFALVRHMFFTLVWVFLWFSFFHKIKGLLESSSYFLKGGAIEYLYDLAFLGSVAPVLYILYLYLHPIFGRNKEDSLNLLSDEEMNKKLATIPFFSMMDVEKRSFIVENISSKIYKRNKKIFHQDEGDFGIFIILDGKVQTYFKEKNGKLVNKPMGYFSSGEILLLDNISGTVSAKAVKDTLVASVPKNIFYDYVIDEIVSKDEARRIIQLSSFLQHHPIFSYMRTDDLSKLIDKLRFSAFSENEQLLNGKEANLKDCFIVYKGELEVSNNGKTFDLFMNDIFFPCHTVNNGAFHAVMKKSGGLLSIGEEDFKDLIWNKFSDEQFLQKI